MNPCLVWCCRWKQKAHFDTHLGEDMESWFWEIVTSMTLHERSAVYKFVTGSSRITTSDEFEQLVRFGITINHCGVACVDAGFVIFMVAR